MARGDYPWSLRGRSLKAQWAVMLALSAVFVVLLELVRLPAALMLGPMIGAILVSVSGGRWGWRRGCSPAARRWSAA